jgi:NADPH:quinone reductase-like Zn-dependent oxidoreductase
MSTPSMRAISQDEFGPPEVLHPVEVPRPSPLPTEVLVQVHSAGVNPVDLKTRSGSGMAAVLGDPPFILGWDVAGVVVERGFGVHTLRVGDEVFGMPWVPRQAGAYAEYVTAPSRQFVRRPTRLDQDQAAAVPLAALTAWQALVDAAGVQGGQRVLIQAATGGVGHFAVQIAKYLGAYVMGTGRGDKLDAARRLGADEMVDYRTTRFEDVLHDVDVVLDLVGDEIDRTSTRSLDVLRPGGLLVAVPSGVSPDLIENGQQRGLRVHDFLVEPDGAALATLASLFDEGRIEVLLGGTLPLDQAAEAHRRLERGEVEGKLVLRVDH